MKSHARAPRNRLLCERRALLALAGQLQSDIGLYRGMFRIRLIMCLGKASWVSGHADVLPGWVALFFYTVNQVLVRLWARVTRDRSLDRLRVPSFNRIV